MFFVLNTTTKKWIETKDRAWQEADPSSGLRTLFELNSIQLERKQDGQRERAEEKGWK